MFRRDDFQFFAMCFGLAVMLHSCDWAVSQAFNACSTKALHQETSPVEQVQPPKPVIAPVVEKIPSPVKISDHDRKQRCRRSGECSKMAEALVYEARGESLKGALAVGYVIVERTKNPTRWPKTVRGVIAQRDQFSYTTRRQKVQPKAEDWERAYITSYRILNGEAKNPIGKSDHYHTLKVRPKWARKMQYVATVGRHKFYKDIE